MFNLSTEFPFLAGAPLVMACHLTGIFDVNRTTVLPNDDFSLVEAWASSLKTNGVNGIIFHNNFSETTIKEQQHAQLSFIRVGFNNKYNPNIYRYLIYSEFLNRFVFHISALFVTDVSDVVMVQNPFIAVLFYNNTDTLFCGDEPKPLHNEWMQSHSEYLRHTIADYEAYENYFRDSPLLNCGIIGGSSIIMQRFINALTTLHKAYNQNNPTLYTGDMGAFNYLVRTKFNQKLLHGVPINTLFKGYEKERTDCWFRHK